MCENACVRGFLVLSFIATGCGSSKTDSPEAHPPSVPSCAQLTDHVLHLFAPVDDYARNAAEVFRARCTQDAWSDEMRTCVLNTSSVTQPQSCNAKLTPAQKIKLGDDLAGVEARSIPPVCERYEMVLGLVGKCDKLPGPLRVELQQRFDAAKATWNTTVDKRELGPMCSTALAAVKSAGALCPGSETW